MKKIWFVSLFILFFITACTQNEPLEYKQDQVITEDEFLQYLAAPGAQAGAGKSVIFGAQIFNMIQQDDEFNYYQAYINPQELDKQVMIYVPKEMPIIEENTFVKVEGVINHNEFLAESESGNLISALAIRAFELETSTFKDAIAPSLKTIEVNQSHSQNDVIVTVEKLEFSEYDTRLFIEIENHSNEDVTLFSHDFKLKQDTLTYAQADHFVLDYPELENILKPNHKTQAILSYNEMDYETISSIEVFITGILRDHLAFNDIVFEVQVQ